MQAGATPSSWSFALKVAGALLKGQDPSGCRLSAGAMVRREPEGEGVPEVWPQDPSPFN